MAATPDAVSQGPPEKVIKLEVKDPSYPHFPPATQQQQQSPTPWAEVAPIKSERLEAKIKGLIEQRDAELVKKNSDEAAAELEEKLASVGERKLVVVSDSETADVKTEIEDQDYNLTRRYKCFNCNNWITENKPAVPFNVDEEESKYELAKKHSAWRYLELPKIPRHPTMIEYELNVTLVNCVRSEGGFRHFHQAWALHVFKVISHRFASATFYEKKVIMAVFGPWWAQYWPQYMPRMPMRRPNHIEKPTFVSHFGLQTVDGNLPRPVAYRANAAGTNFNGREDTPFRRVKARDYLYELLLSDAAENWGDPVRYFLGHYWASFYPTEVRLIDTSQDGIVTVSAVSESSLASVSSSSSSSSSTSFSNASV